MFGPFREDTSEQLQVSLVQRTCFKFDLVLTIDRYPIRFAVFLDLVLGGILRESMLKLTGTDLVMRLERGFDECLLRGIAFKSFRIVFILPCYSGSP